MKRIIKIIITVATILSLSYSITAAFAPGVSTGEPIRVTGIVLQQMTASGNNVYVIWKDFDQRMLFFARSDDNGHTFHEPVGLGNFVGDALVAASGNNVYVAWVSGTNGVYEVVFRRSIDNGATFSESMTLSWSTESIVLQQLEASDSNVYVVWIAYSQGILIARFIASTDNGATFGKAVDLGNLIHGSFDPSIAASGSKVYAVWEPNASLATSNDNGESFGRIMQLTSDTKDGFSTNTKLAISGSNVYVVWQHNGYGYGKVMFRKSTDNEKTFDDVLSFSNNGQEGYPVVKASSNNVYLFWQSHSNGTKDIILTSSKDNGSTFSKPINVSNNTAYSDNNYIFRQTAVDGKSVYAVWSAWRPAMDGLSEILFRKSTDGGNTFDDVITLYNITGPFLSKPQIDVSQNNVYVAWQEMHDGTKRLFFGSSHDNGNTFDKTIISTSNSDSNYSAPLIPPSSITVKTDKNTYALGENVIISGKVAMVEPEKMVSVKIYDPAGELYRSEDVHVASDGSYTLSLNLDKFGPAGEYLVKATYDLNYPTNQAGTIFTYIVPYDLIINGKSYPIKYTITWGKLNNITANANEKSLIVYVNSTGSGTLTIDLPRSLIDSTQNNLDAAFTVLINNKHDQFNYREIYTDAHERTLQIYLPYSEKNQEMLEIRIVGTTVVPEFPVSLIALAASFAGLIAIRRFVKVRRWCSCS